ncbi:MFS transporter [Leekyejoonella antrihumi]|uniref:MFS transporter n=2 Tax=Leekyejoonella antrihumi TaxID=1660198 RepID=A0A563E3C6_9MICO|nr:MFS transporter [Leekyejoonella antrihumi]
MSGALAMTAIVVVSVNLRPGATSVGPALEEIQHGLGMSATLAGVMTALPGLCFGVVGALAVRLAQRLGLTGGIALGLLAIIGGLVLRVLTGSVWVFLLLTLVALAGMAVGNVLVPAWIKRHATDGGERLMTIYSMGLTLGGAVGSLFVAPLIDHAPDGWRSALGVWALTALVAVVPWAVISRRERKDPADHRMPRVAHVGRMTSSRTAVALCVYFGVQAMNAYVQFGWLPQIYRDAGLSVGEAGSLLAMLTGLGVVGGLLMPMLIARSSNMSWAVLLLGVCMVLGYLGLWLAPASTPWLWAALLGIAGWTFPGAIAMITARTRDPQVTGQVSGFVQPVGYVLAAVGPLLVGVIHELTGGWSAVVILLALSGVVMTGAGLLVAKRTYIDDELHTA